MDKEEDKRTGREGEIEDDSTVLPPLDDRGDNDSSSLSSPLPAKDQERELYEGDTPGPDFNDVADEELLKLLSEEETVDIHVSVLDSLLKQSGVERTPAQHLSPPGRQHLKDGHAPHILINPIYLKLYKAEAFLHAYPFYVLTPVRVGRSKSNEIYLNNQEISRHLLQLYYKGDGTIEVTYSGRTLLSLAGRELPAGYASTEEVHIGDEIVFSEYRIVLADNDRADVGPLLYQTIERATDDENILEGMVSDTSAMKSEDEEICSYLAGGRKTRILSARTKALVKYLVVPATVVALLLSVSWVVYFKDKTAGAGVAYSTGRVTRMNLQETMDFPGIINFLDPYPVVNILPGKILETGFKDGDFVEAGQMLFRIDGTQTFQQLQQARADLIVAGANFKKLEKLETSTEYSEIAKSLMESRNNLNRALQRKHKSERLFEKGIMSKNELERSEVEHENALNQYQNLEAKAAQAKANFVTARKVAAIALEKSKMALRDLEILYQSGVLKAPLSGIITVPVTNAGKTVYAKGQQLSSDSIVASIGDFSNIGLKIEVSESQVGKLHENQKVTITTEMLQGMHISGVLSEIARVATIKENSSVFDIKIKINTSEELNKVIKVGVTASASVILAEKEMVLAVPVNAVFDYEGRSALLYLDKKGAISLAPVSTGLSNQGFIELTDTTLAEGTVVITSHIDEILSSSGKSVLPQGPS